MLMECPRKYQYGILQGWRQIEDKVDLEFGGFFASAAETYKKARLSGKSKEQATIDAVRYVVEATWIGGYKPGRCPCPDGCNGCNMPEGSEAQTGKPWGGRYETLWRCTGSEPFRNAKGNKAKCPWSHKGVWLPWTAPSECGHCGSKTETQRQWISDNKTKDRYTLVRLVSWYCDEQAEDVSEGPYPFAFPNGQPAVELSFKMPLPWKTPAVPYDESPRSDHHGGKIPDPRGDEYREPYILCGHLDSIMTFGTEKFIADNKTTKKALGTAYFASYSPSIQMDIYDLAGNVLYPSLGIRGVMVEGAQVLQEGARFGVGIQYRTDKRREELMADLKYWIGQAEKFAADDHWPMNRASCVMCQFKSVCSKDPSQRQMFLESNFVKQPWNPLQER